MLTLDRPVGGRLRHHYEAFLVAVQFLTRLPTPRVDLADEGRRAALLGQATAYFPAVGALVGASTAG